jgi:hypothetical protein
MKRFAATALALLLIAAGVYVYLSANVHANANAAALFPSGPAPCPSDPNDLAGIEGWAPGAGQAEKIGQGNAQSMGGFGGALAGGNAATPTPEATAACRGITPEVQAYFDRMNQRLALLPDDGYDPNVRAKELGTADAIFAFVRDDIRTEAYPGEMRGPSGTLQARGGSSIDKAYLLAGMLGAIGVPARLVHSQLSDDETNNLVNQIAGSSLPALPAAPQLADAFKQIAIDENTAKAQADAGVAGINAKVDAQIAAAQAPTSELAADLQNGHAPLATNTQTTLEQWNRNVRDHWWVQVQQNGAWTDWDPSTPAAAPGTHLGGAPQGDALALPGADQQTTLTVRVVADYERGPSQTLVQASDTMANLYGIPISISIGDRSRGTQDLTTATSFTPSINLGSASTSGDAFQLDPAGGPRVTALHLQIETNIPDQPARTIDRPILDRRGAGGNVDPSWTPQRSAYAVTTTYSMLALSGDLDPSFAAEREGDGLKAVRAFVAYVSAGGYGVQLPPAGMAAAYPIEDLHYYEQDAIARHRLEAAGKGTLHFFFDRPQIVMMHRALSLHDGKLTGIEQFDIVDNGMVAVGSDPQAAINANFVRGYLDTSIEQHLLAARSDGGTIALFAVAKRAGIGGAVSTDPKFGGTAIVPQRPVQIDGRDRTGWWQVDPSTGNLVGRMDRGAGQELVEYAIARANDWSTLYSMLQFYGDFFRCIAGAVEAPLAGHGGAQNQEWFKQCAGAALCGYFESMGAGFAFGAADDKDVEALIYNILDFSVPGAKDSWPGSLGAVCGKQFTSPL